MTMLTPFLVTLAGISTLISATEAKAINATNPNVDLPCKFPPKEVVAMRQRLFFTNG